MAYPAGHREEVRNRMVTSARKLFNRHGFDSVSINVAVSLCGFPLGQRRVDLRYTNGLRYAEEHEDLDLNPG